MATVVLSFAAALGVSYVVSTCSSASPASDPSLPLFAFVFLVALGVDYNIFLMTRVREEAERTAPARGCCAASRVTGGVITWPGSCSPARSRCSASSRSCSSRARVRVAFGVLLDTLLVRTLLVPALVLDIGEQGVVAVEARAQ